MAIRLLINGQEADLGSNADGLLLFTYGQGDLDAPAIVQNAYSKEVVLPPTQRNAGIFGAWMQTDKVRGTADGFDALARVPFQIRDNGDEVLEAGYVKLESISAEGYTLHLFGGLGSFLYGLMYGTDGSKKSLASLTWGALDAGLSFNIDAEIVQDAWDRIATAPATIADPYDIVNFAPMHNGRPTDFDCDKGLVPVGAAHGCPIPPGATECGITIGGVEYALAQFSKEQGEWDVRDLRSYLQRPVFNLRALFVALEDEARQNGYTFDWSAIANEWFAYTWMTLPMLSAEGLTEKGGAMVLSWYDTEIDHIGAGNVLAPINPTPAMPTAGKVSAAVNMKLGIDLPADNAYPYAWIDEGSYIFLRLIGYDSSNNVVKRGKILCLCSTYHGADPAAVAQVLPTNTSSSPTAVANSILGAFNPAEIVVQEQGMMNAAGSIVLTDFMQLTIEGYGIHHYGVAIVGGTWTGTDYLVTRLSAGTEYGYAEARERLDAADVTAATATYSAEDLSRPRTGAHITKQALLGGTASPAEILLSFVKTFGLVLRYDAIGKVVSLVERDAFYGGGADIDLSQRIDRTQPVRVVPNGIEAKWLNFSHQQALGAFAERYAAKYGAQYGAQRVNTGSPFNADTLEVLEGVGFVAGVTGLAYSRYYYLLESGNLGTGILPSALLDNGAKYTLWGEVDDEPDGDAVEHEILPVGAEPALSSINAYSEMGAPGYDGFFRLQLENADGSAASGDGAGILLFFDGMAREYAHLTDDANEMLNKNEGVPCWIPCLDDTPHLSVPHFISYHFLRSWGGAIDDSLDMGTPRQIDMPKMNYDEGKSIYARRWAAYIADRYNADAHRVTARVDWRGYQIGQDLFRNFYWFDGCWWVLEKMTDYCWNNPQPCECTFVRVLDKGAYTNGQN